MPMIKAITSGVESFVTTYREQRQRAEQERLVELQYAREMRTRAEPGSNEYYYYNAIVKRLGAI